MPIDNEGVSPSSSLAYLPERFALESPAFTALRSRIADAIQKKAAWLAGRWDERFQIIEPGESDERNHPSLATPATALVAALASAVASDEGVSDSLAPLGLTIGADAFELGTSMHQVLRRLDRLSAMTLYAMQASLEDEAEATAADGLRLSRRLQQAVSFLTLAATEGYVQAMGDRMRDHFRLLRHDLQNPVGTIKSVLAMMDDDSMPMEVRTHPRFRAMAKRNANALGQLITERLSDTAAVLPVRAWQRVSLRAIASTVRRDLRAEAAARETTVVVSSAVVHAIVDAAALELMLHELLLATLLDVQPRDDIYIGFSDERDDRVAVSVCGVPARVPYKGAKALEQLAALARRMGGKLEASAQGMMLSVPVQRVKAVRPVSDVASALEVAPAGDSIGPPTSASSGGESGYDLRGAGEREHGQPRPL